MANTTFTVTVIDQWPKLKLLITRGPNVRNEGPYQYDIAASQFEPAVKDSLRLAVDEVVKLRRK